MRVHLLPVYSKLASPNLMARVLSGRRMPAGLVLHEHQALTLDALEDPSVDVVANTAMTGAGKSLAAYLHPLLGQSDPGEPPPTILALYPTNELARDQKRQFVYYQGLFGTGLRFDDLSGTKLTRLQGVEYGARANALSTLLKTNEVLLTNPDIFARIMNYQYRSGIYSLQELPYSVLTQFDLFLFDEFHVFSMPQFTSAATALAYAQVYLLDHRPKAMFASATQNEALLQLIQRAGLNVRVVQGSYTNTQEDGYRQILKPADLHLCQLEGEQNAEAWVREHVDIIERALYDSGDHPGRVAIIVSSVAAARRIARYLSEAFASIRCKPGGVRVEEITGLAHGSIEGDIVVGTSTIDVGVDFDINLLIFEASNAGEFLQRLGRLGRCRRNGLSFASSNAYALISAKTPWVSTRLEEELAARGARDGDFVDRPTMLRQAVEVAFPSETSFKPYAKRWGAVQAYHVVHAVRHGLKEKAYSSLADRLEARYGQIFEWRKSGAMGRYYRLLDDSSTGRTLLDEVLSFRGSSPFQVALWDATRHQSSDAFKPYDLFFILTATRWEPLETDRFFAELQRNTQPDEYEDRKREFEWVLQQRGQPLCLKMTDVVEDRNRLVLQLDRYLDDAWLERPVVIKGIRIEQPVAPAIRQVINPVLARQKVVCYLTRREMPEVRRIRLPALFPLYRLHALGNGQDYTVAFGKPALMLDALIRSQRWRGQRSDHSPIFS